MANENDINDFWSWTDKFDNTVQLREFGGMLNFYTDCERWEEVGMPKDKIRELRDFLTAKLEGDDGRD